MLTRKKRRRVISEDVLKRKRHQQQRQTNVLTATFHQRLGSRAPQIHPDKALIASLLPMFQDMPAFPLTPEKWNWIEDPDIALLPCKRKKKQEMPTIDVTKNYQSMDKLQRRYFHWSVEDRRNLCILGGGGRGKSFLLQTLVYETCYGGLFS
jgi:hypothetical protein